jgi:hypothetical protein
MSLYTEQGSAAHARRRARGVRRLGRGRHRDRDHGRDAGAGMPMDDALATANRAGGIVVGKLGTATVTREELFPANKLFHRMCLSCSNGRRQPAPPGRVKAGRGRAPRFPFPRRVRNMIKKLMLAIAAGRFDGLRLRPGRRQQGRCRRARRRQGRGPEHVESHPGRAQQGRVQGLGRLPEARQGREGQEGGGCRKPACR